MGASQEKKGACICPVDPRPVRADAAEEAWINQIREADHLIEEGRYNEAEESYISARKQAELFGADQLPMAITLNRIGYQCHITGRLRDVERPYAVALTIVQKRFGAASHNAVKFAMDLSTAYFELDKISQAESLIRRFLSLDPQLSANDRAIVLAELGSVLAARQKFAEAESLYQQALPFFEREPDGELRERTVIILTDLSNCYVHMRRPEEGTRYSDRALAALRRIANPPAHLSFKTIANAAAVSAAVDRSPRSHASGCRCTGADTCMASAATHLRAVAFNRKKQDARQEAPRRFDLMFRLISTDYPEPLFDNLHRCWFVEPLSHARATFQHIVSRRNLLAEICCCALGVDA